MEPSQRLNRLLDQAEPIPLDRVLAVIATVDPLDPPDEETIVEEIDGLAQDCPDDGSADTVLDHVFGRLGFSGDAADYYNPANSLIHNVLERRRGIPLTLAAVASEVARRREIDLRLIGMPGHVLLGQGPEPSVWFDPFNRGARLGHDDCRALFARFHPIEAFVPEMLRPIGAEAVTVRMLNNLRVAYTRRGQAGLMVPVLELRAAMASAEPNDRLELVNLLAVLGRFDRAAELLESLAETDPERRAAYLIKAHSYRAHRN